MVKIQVDKAIVDRILRAASELFARKGFSATSTREIAEAVGVTKPVIYYYFQSKEGLFRAAFDRVIQKLLQLLRDALDYPIDQPREFLVDVVRRQLECKRDHLDLARVCHALYFGPEDQAAIVDFETVSRELVELLLAVVRRANANGCLIPENREHDFVENLRGMMFLAVVGAYRHGLSLDRARAEQLVGDLLDGFSLGRSKTASG